MYIPFNLHQPKKDFTFPPKNLETNNFTYITFPWFIHHCNPIYSKRNTYKSKANHNYILWIRIWSDNSTGNLRLGI